MAPEGKTGEAVDDGAAFYLRASEERFREDETLREEIEQTRAQLRAAEARILQRDNTILELRFEAENADTETAFQQRRIRELEVSNRALASQLGNIEGDSAAISASSQRRAGERFKRERDLEGVIESQNRVITKLQAENERLTKRGVSTAKVVEAQKELRHLRSKVKDLEGERETLRTKVAEATSFRMDTARQREQLSQLKRNLRSTKEEVVSLRETVRNAERAKESTFEELQQANKKLLVLREERTQLRSRSSVVSEDEARKLRQQLATVKDQLARKSEELERVRSRRSIDGDGISPTSSSSGLKAEVDRLRAENKRLTDELASFDLEFFEEVEDLKYRYHEAQAEIRRLRARQP